MSRTLQQVALHGSCRSWIEAVPALDFSLELNAASICGLRGIRDRERRSTIMTWTMLLARRPVSNRNRSDRPAPNRHYLS